MIHRHDYELLVNEEMKMLDEEIAQMKEDYDQEVLAL